MRFVEVRELRTLRLRCVGCKQHVDGGQAVCNLDGVPFAAFYCLFCAAEALDAKRNARPDVPPMVHPRANREAAE